MILALQKTNNYKIPKYETCLFNISFGIDRDIVVIQNVMLEIRFIYLQQKYKLAAFQILGQNQIPNLLKYQCKINQ